MGRYDLYERKRGIGPFWLMTILLLLAAAGGGVWFYMNSSNQPAVESGGTTTIELTLPEAPLPPQVPNNKNQTAVPSPLPPASATETAEPQLSDAGALPALENSDGFFREKILSLSQGLAPFLTSDNLIPKFVRVVNDFAQGHRVHKNMQFFKLSEPFVANVRDQNDVLGKSSHDRYNALAAAIDSIDAQAAVNVYRTLNALGQQVFAEFGYPDSYKLDDIFSKAASEIIAAPVLEEPVKLEKSKELYKFADPKLETSNPVHKQMFRMGPQNTRIIQNKLRAIAEALVSLKE